MRVDHATSTSARRECYTVFCISAKAYKPYIGQLAALNGSPNG